nr:MAG TPA: hypothetical protein [Caudoviricetes sp.]
MGTAPAPAAASAESYNSNDGRRVNKSHSQRESAKYFSETRH